MKIQVKQASKTKKSQFDLSGQHITTADFGTIQPTYFAEVVPGDTFDLSMRVAARLSPLAVPTYGDIEVVSRAFFVPMRSIFQGFNEWISRNNDLSLSSSIPTVTNQVLQNWFWDDESENRGLSYKVTSDVAYDFSVNSSYFRFTSKGRWLYKVLISLGYSINFSASSGDNADHTEMSLLPILAFMRVLYDFVYPSDYVNNLGVGYIFEQRQNETPANIIEHIVDLMYQPYPQDFYTAAWQNPNSKGPSTAQGIKLPEAYPGASTNPGAVVGTNSNNVYFMDYDTSGPTSAESGTSVITAYGHRVLDALNNFITRNNIAGSRFFEQLFTRFGIKSQKATPNRSVFLKSFIDKVSIIDVTSMAGTEQTELGEQGAKGLMTGNQKHHLKFDASDENYGYLMVLSHIQPRTFYYQGRKKHVLHIQPLDFFTPEFDNIGLQVIRNDEVFADFKTQNSYVGAASYGGRPNGVFGFSPRYSEYKSRHSHDVLSGDFRVDSSNAGLDSYHLGRVLPTPSSRNPLALNSQFLGIRQHEFDRIFQNVYDSTDGFGTLHLSGSMSGDGVNFSWEGDYLTFNGKPILGRSGSSTPTGWVYINVLSDGSLQTHYVQNADVVVNSILRVLGISSSTIPSASNALWGFSSASQTAYLVYQMATSEATTMTVGGFGSRGYISQFTRFAPGTLPVYTLEELQASVSQYFDHFVMYYQFDVRCYRKMLTISESMPITDGSRELSVDAYGTHLN